MSLPRAGVLSDDFVAPTTMVYDLAVTPKTLPSTVVGAAQNSTSRLGGAEPLYSESVALR